MYSDIPVDFLDNTYHVHWSVLAVFVYICIYFCFIRFCKVLKAAAIKAGRGNISAAIVSYSPLVLFPLLPLILGYFIKPYFATTEISKFLLMLCSLLIYPPYFIFMFGYCKVSKQDMESINGDT